MEKSSSQSSNTFLPQEIIWDILLRLPVRSLCRFRLVKGKFFFSADYPQDPEDLVQVSSSHGRISTTGFTISQSVGGLVCIDTDEGIQICNPSTGECITFPTLPDRASDCFLGYDPIEKKHKLLRSSYLEPLTEIDVLTLGEKEWKRINLDLGFIVDLGESVCIDGVMHIYALSVDHESYFLLFDVRSENFRAIPFPEEYEYDARRYLMEFGGRAALVDYHAVAVEGLGGEIRLWILKDAQNQVWSCKTVTPSLHLGDTLSYKPLCVGVTHEGELIFAPPLYMGPFHCYLYHVENATFRKVEIRGLYERIIGLRCLYDDKVAVSYHVESLQSLRDIRFD
ncbi:putative F-box protein At1g47730 [Punica granatum]|uniref:F-box protein At1g47730 n=1 Tax=Punica granatum TaxID=22663 RepID=A0A6P8DYZ9_PUNGR|nr:putative F-box protein At1g47730 [Punica granatum]